LIHFYKRAMSESVESKNDARIEDGWFLDKNYQWPGQCIGVEVKEVLHREKTKYQDLMVFQSTHWGKALVLDGVIQLTERDEMSYQELLAHIPLYSHPCPKSVLIVGGGDGGIARECLKHPSVEKITQVEIDEAVPRVCKQYFPTLACSFSDPKVELKIEDAVKYVAECPPGQYDVVIVDSSDPDGPADKLFTPEFYRNVSRLLTPEGVLSAQGECFWIHEHIMKPLLETGKEIFSSAEYATIQVPTYICGQICAFVLSKSRKSCSTPVREVDTTNLRYYSAKMHAASFVLPLFVEKKLGL